MSKIEILDVIFFNKKSDELFKEITEDLYDCKIFSNGEDVGFFVLTDVFDNINLSSFSDNSELFDKLISIGVVEWDYFEGYIVSKDFLLITKPTEGGVVFNNEYDLSFKLKGKKALELDYQKAKMFIDAA